MKRGSLLIASILLVSAVVYAQAPAGQAPANQTPPAPKPPAQPASGAAVPGKVAVIDFTRAVTENVEGKKAAEKWQAEAGKKQAEFEKKQKTVEDLQNKLKNQGNVLNDATRADYNRQIEQINTDMNRMNEDAQRDMGELRQQLFRPIAEVASKVMNAYANEVGLAVVLDVSSENSSVVYFQDVADITTEIIRRVDSELAKAKPAEPAKKD
jgi:Skp family chaperone for outer membrane proteins